MKYKKVIGSVFGCLIIAGVIALHSWWQQPSIAKYRPQTSVAVQGAQITIVPLESRYITTGVPDFLHSKNTYEKSLGPIYGQYLYINKDPNVADQVGVTVASRESRELTEVSSVKLRTTNGSLYNETTLLNAPVGARVFSAVNNYEISVFWSYQDMYAAVVVSGTADRRPQLEQTMTTILTSWQWR